MIEGVDQEKLRALVYAQLAVDQAEEARNRQRFSSIPLIPVETYDHWGQEIDRETAHQQWYQDEQRALDLALEARDRCLREAGLELEPWLERWKEAMAAARAELST